MSTDVSVGEGMPLARHQPPQQPCHNCHSLHHEYKVTRMPHADKPLHDRPTAAQRRPYVQQMEVKCFGSMCCKGTLIQYYVWFVMQASKLTWLHTQ